MNEIKHLPKSLPKKSPFFEIKEAKGDTTGEVYYGSFECQIPSLRTQSEISKYKAFLNGGLDATLDKQTLNLHHMHAYCKYCVTKAPDWFVETDYGLDLYDQNILEKVYYAVLEKEENWLITIWGEPKDKKEDKKTDE